MSELSTEGAAGAAEQQPIAEITVEGEGKLSLTEAARALAGARKPKEQQEAGEQRAESAAPPAARESADEAGAAPPETEVRGETEEGADPANLPPIEPPRSWTKEDKELFTSLPRETQERIAERERSRESDFLRRQNEAADKLKGLTVGAGQVAGRPCPWRTHPHRLRGKSRRDLLRAVRAAVPQPLDPPLRCPSAQPGMADAQILGVVSRDSGEPRLAYLNERIPATPELLAQAAPADPREIFRLAARCEQSKCVHFDGARCQLATRIVEMLPEVTGSLPPCTIRRTCRWYQQEGRAACFRCPQVVTFNLQVDERMKRVAGTPPAGGEDS